MDNKKLDSLRQKLDAIDEDIIRLIAERQVNVDQIGSVKLRTKSPTRDYEREKQVMDNVKAAALKHRVDPAVAQSIFSQIIRSSLTKQENQKLSHSDFGENKSALIIGGAGKMGQWFAHFLTSQGFRVDIADPAANPDTPHLIEDYREHPLNHDFIIVAAPIQTSAEILECLARRKPEGIVLDISSIKSPLRLPLRKLADAGVRVVSIHPMFGPDVKLLSNRHIVFIEINDQEAVNQVKCLFEPTMAERIDMKLEDHDRLVAYVLGLSHALNLAFLTVLSESGEAADTLARLSSTTFDAQWAISASLSRENPHLYYEIQKLNNYSVSTLNALSDAVLRLNHLISEGNEAAFVKLMHMGRRFINQRPD